MSDEEGNGVEGGGELASPEWRVRAGPRNRPTQKEREGHEAMHVPLRERENGVIENTVMLLQGIIRTVRCHTECSMEE